MRARLTLAALLCGCGADATLLAPWSGQTFTEGDDVPIVIAAACGAEGALPVQALLDGAPIADDRFTCDRDLITGSAAAVTGVGVHDLLVRDVATGDVLRRSFLVAAASTAAAGDSPADAGDSPADAGDSPADASDSPADTDATP